MKFNIKGIFMSALLVGFVMQSFFFTSTIQSQKTEETLTTHQESYNKEEQSFFAIMDKNQMNQRKEHMNDIVYAGKFLTTAYCCEKYRHVCGEGKGITYGGVPVQQNLSVAADLNVFPLGTWLYIEDVGIRQVQDIGGSIKNNKLDVAVDTHKNALSWSGYGEHRVFVLPNYHYSGDAKTIVKPC